MADLRQLLKIPSDLDEKSTKLLLKAIKESNQDGFDYLEFLMSVQKLKEMQMDEVTAMKSAYATASAFGLSKQALVSSGHFYVNILRREYQAFKDALSRQIEKKIQAPEAKVVKMQKDHDDIDRQVDLLLKKKASLKEQIAKYKAQIELDKTSLSEREQKFNDSFNRIKETIESDLTNINDHLQ